MKCFHCQLEITGKIQQVPPCTYHGTVTYIIKRGKDQTDEEYYRNFHEDCYLPWWNDLTWHLDSLDERMNVNIHFKRIKGNIGTYKGKHADSSWNGVEARHFLGEYEFINRRPHPETCKGYCDLKV